MPKVPTYDQPTVQENVGRPVSVNFTPSIQALGGGPEVQGLFKSVANLAEKSSDIYQKEKSKADELATLEAKTNLEKKQQELLYSPKGGALSRQGKNAFDIENEFGSQFESHADSIEEGLSNNEQKMMFKKIRLSMGADFNGTLAKHLFKEKERYDDETTQSAISALQNKAELNYKDPEKIYQSVSEASAIFDSWSARKGMDEETSKTQKQALQSKIHSGVIARYLANDEDIAANNYYQLIKGIGQVSGNDAAILENKLKDGSSRGQSRREADKLLAEYGNDFSAAIKAAERIEDTKIYDMTVQRLEHRASQVDSMRRASQSAAADGADDILKKSGGDIAMLMRSPVWGQMSTAQQQDKIKMSRYIREGIEPVTDWSLYYNLKTQAASTELRSKFLKLDLREMKSKFDDRTWHELVNIQTSLREKDGKADKHLEDFRTKQDIFLTEMGRAGFDPTPKDTDAEKMAIKAEARRIIGERQAAFQRQTGREMTNEEFQTMAQGVLSQKVLSERSRLNPARWFGDKYYQESMIKESAADKPIPPSDREKIINQLEAAKKAGKYFGPIDDKAIKTQYLYLKGRR